jgi:2-polyprenyl-3-methyl-5-hydroxy-6-metoxy-1,4-benzoquinol methylase
VNKFDLLVSFGFLEHFANPGAILSKWKTILKPSGLVISVIPNLFSINGVMLRKFDQELWRQHICYSPKDMDQFHREAGLIPVQQAQYIGSYDIHMLIPWDKIKVSMNNDFLFKITKITLSYGVGKILKLLPKSNMKTLNSFVVGVYAPNKD